MTAAAWSARLRKLCGSRGIDATDGVFPTSSTSAGASESAVRCDLAILLPRQALRIHRCRGPIRNFRFCLNEARSQLGCREKRPYSRKGPWTEST